MSSLDRRPSSRWRAIAAGALAVAAGACGDSDDHASQASRVAVLSAFPAELAAVLEHTTIDQTMVVDEHTFRLGTIGGTPVVVAMTGIGLLNAEATTNLLLDNFKVQGVIVSGVAGSAYRIGDVAVPEAWEFADGTTYKVDSRWLAIVKDVAAGNNLPFENCTLLPMKPTHDPVCFPFVAVVVVGGVGQSADPFGDRPFQCTPMSGDVFGCDVSLDSGAADVFRPHAADKLALDMPIAQDMETAAIARAAAEHHVRFIAFRATSDGAGDPQGDRGFPTQFFDYYRLAAHNAAAAAAALVDRLTPGR